MISFVSAKHESGPGFSPLDLHLYFSFFIHHIATLFANKNVRNDLTSLYVEPYHFYFWRIERDQKLHEQFSQNPNPLWVLLCSGCELDFQSMITRLNSGIHLLYIKMWSIQIHVWEISRVCRYRCPNAPQAHVCSNWTLYVPT